MRNRLRLARNTYNALTLYKSAILLRRAEGNREQQQQIWILPSAET
jgi:hypothetical protein